MTSSFLLFLRRGSAIAIFATILFAVHAGLASTPTSAQPTDPQEQPQAYLVQFRPTVSEEERNGWLSQHGAELVAWLPQIGVAEVRPAAGAAAAAFAELSASPALNAAMLESSALTASPVTFVEQDVAVSGDAAILDPGFIDPERGYGQHLMRLAPAWRVTKGSPKIVIAIIDSGINPNHPEFRGRLVGGYDFINNDTDPADDHGHGTHVAGIAAAGLNGVGTAGSCPQCKIMAIKVLNQRNGGTWSSVAKGILYAVDHGAHVINLSLGATISSSTLEAAVEYAHEHDVVVVAAAGNMGANFEFYPAALPNVFAVSGTDRNDQRWIVSSYGNYVDVSAPAVSIYSAYNDLANTSGYAYMSGTSMASPFVAGLAGLVLSRKPHLHAAEVTELIAQTSTDLGARGKDVYYGHGRVDAYRALIAANDGVVPAPNDPDDDNGGAKTHAVYLPVLSTATTPSN